MGIRTAPIRIITDSGDPLYKRPRSAAPDSRRDRTMPGPFLITAPGTGCQGNGANPGPWETCSGEPGQAGAWGPQKVSLWK